MGNDDGDVTALILKSLKLFILRWQYNRAMHKIDFHNDMTRLYGKGKPDNSLRDEGKVKYHEHMVNVYQSNVETIQFRMKQLGREK